MPDSEATVSFRLRSLEHNADRLSERHFALADRITAAEQRTGVMNEQIEGLRADVVALTVALKEANARTGQILMAVLGLALTIAASAISIALS